MEAEQAVIVQFNYGIQDLDPLFALEELLQEVIEEKQLGEYDGNEMGIDNTNGVLYAYGPNAEKLFSAIKPILAHTSFMQDATITLRFGPPGDGVKETMFTL